MKRTKTIRKLTVYFGVLLLGLLISNSGVAQNTSGAARNITGKIVSKSGEAISGASITVKGTRNTVTTNGSGEFSILTGNGEILVVSSIGFTQQEIRIGNNTNNLHVALSDDYSNLQDVVVVGYGTMKKTDMSSSQVTVTAEDIEKTVNTTFDQALQGRAANVYVSSPSGQPGRRRLSSSGA